ILKYLNGEIRLEILRVAAAIHDGKCRGAATRPAEVDGHLMAGTSNQPIADMVRRWRLGFRPVDTQDLGVEPCPRGTERDGRGGTPSHAGFEAPCARVRDVVARVK